MVSRRLLTVVALVTTAVSFFLLGVFHARTDDAFEFASYDAKLDAIRAEVRSELIRARHTDGRAKGTSGESVNSSVSAKSRDQRRT